MVGIDNCDSWCDMVKLRGIFFIIFTLISVQKVFSFELSENPIAEFKDWNYFYNDDPFDEED